jgi:hypothetical protein
VASLRPTHGDHAVDAVKVRAQAFIPNAGGVDGTFGGYGKTRAKRFRAEVGAIARGGRIVRNLRTTRCQRFRATIRYTRRFCRRLMPPLSPMACDPTLDRSVQANPI